MDSKTARRRLKRKDTSEEVVVESNDTLIVPTYNKENQDPQTNLSNQTALSIPQDSPAEIDSIKHLKSTRKLKRLKFIEHKELVSTQDTVEDTKEEPMDTILSKSIYTAEEEEDYQHSTNQDLPIDAEDDSISQPKHQKKAKKKVTKNKGPKLVIFNKLMDPNIFTAEESVVEEREFLREESLTLPIRDKNNISLDRLMQRFQKQQPDKVISHLAKNVLKKDEHSDSLVIEKPDIVTGFRVKKLATNSRDMLRDALRCTIMERKTSHIDISRVFDKSKTELEGLKKKEEEEDSDFIPEDKEDLEEEELSKLLDLENVESDHELTETCKNTEIPQDPDKESIADEIDELIGLDELSAKTSSESEAENTDSSMELDEEESPEILDTLESETLIINEASRQSTFSSVSRSSDLKIKPVIEPKRKHNIFIDDEAELGSDHEENDERVKHVYDDEESSVDGELEELIDYGNVDTQEKDLADKYMGEELAQDIFKLKKVINGEFVRKRLADDYIDDVEDITNKKAKLIKARADQLEDRFANNSKGKFSELRDQNAGSDEDSEDEMVKYSRQARLIKEITRTEQTEFRFFTAATYDPWFENAKN